MRLRKVLVICGFLCLVAGLIGCGETIRGVGRDFSRIGRGVKTIFVE